MRELLQYRSLLWAWTAREVRVRYKQSILGAAWAILQPLSLMAMFTVVFTYVVRVETGGVPYALFSYTALLPWTTLSTSVVLGSASLINNINLVTKIYFPREILPTAAVLSSLVDLAVASLVFIGLMIYYRYPVHASVAVLPLLLVAQVALALGMVLATSALNVFYRDIRFVVPLAMQLWLYATPVLYPVDLVPERFRGLYMMNPMAGLVDAYRAVLLRGEWPNPAYTCEAVVVSAIVLTGGYWFFKRVEWQFADAI